METSLKEQNFLSPETLLGHLGLASGMWVGDFGVGAGGHFLQAAAKLVGSEGGVVMFDVLKSALSGAMTRAKLSGAGNYRAVWTNLEVYEGAPGVADSSLDAGILVNVLHQSSKTKDILAEIQRMLKPGAKLLVADWKQDASVKIAPPIERRLADGYVLDVAKSLGFSPLERFDSGPYHWAIVIVKT